MVLRKLAAISLLALFVFNTVGYSLLIGFSQRQSDVALENKIDKGDYRTAELVTVKIPLNLPYPTDSKHFESVEGEVMLNGVVYKFVERKIYNDTLILKCILHVDKTELQQRANDYFARVNDLPGKTSTNKKIGPQKFISDDPQFSSNSPFEVCININHALRNNNFIIQQHLSVDDPPPDFLG